MPPSKAPPWLEIRGLFLHRIQSGAWRPGDQIPNETDLAITHGVTRATVSRALRDLAAAGFLDRRRRGGTRVAVNPVRKAVIDVPIIEDDIRKRGLAYEHRLLDHRAIVAPPDVAGALGLGEGRTVWLVRSLHLGDGRPFQLECRWINPAAAAGIATADLSRHGIDVWLLHNAPFARAAIRIHARAAPPEIAAPLGTAPGTALLMVERITRTLRAPLGLLHLWHHPGQSIDTAL